MTEMLRQLEIGRDFPPYIVAEMSGNHNQSLDRALEIVAAAAAAGASAVKLQTYTPDTMTLDLAEREFRINDPDSLWAGRTLYDLYREAHTPWEWHRPIFECCRRMGIGCFSSVFDETSVEFLRTLDVPCYKIASQENTHLPLIRRAAATGKPLIISTGMATLAELDETICAARQAGCRELVLLKCTSSYPADPRESHLATIPRLRELFGVEVGLSDHTPGVGAAVASVALGATLIEKHFTLCRKEGGVDAAFSLEPGEFRQLVDETRRAWQALGTVHFGLSESENSSRVFRRTLYIAQDMQAGDVFTEANLRAIRPGLGIPPKHLDMLLGRRICQDAPRGTPVSWDLVLD